MQSTDRVLLIQDRQLPGHNLLTELQNCSCEVVAQIADTWKIDSPPATEVDLVLINLTGDPGDFLHQLKNDQEYAELPVIAVLETPVNRSTGELLALGLDDVVFFPWDAEEVLARLESRLRMRRLEQSLLTDQGMTVMYQTARHSVEQVEPALQAGIQWLKEIDDTFGIDGEEAHLTADRIQELENILQQVSVSIHRLQDLACARQTGPPIVATSPTSATSSSSRIVTRAPSSQTSARL